MTVARFADCRSSRPDCRDCRLRVRGDEGGESGGLPVRAQWRRLRPTRLRAVSISFAFAALLIGGVAALGVLFLILLIMLMVRTAKSRSGG